MSNSIPSSLKLFLPKCVATLLLIAVTSAKAQQTTNCSDLAAFSSSGSVILQDRASVWGPVRALGDMSIGYDAKQYAHIEVAGSLVMADRSVVSDWVYAGGETQISPNAVIEKGFSSNAPTPCSIQNTQPQWGVRSAFVGDTLIPGNWESVHVPYGSVLYVHPGEYQIGSLELQNDAKIVFLADAPVIIHVYGDLSFGDRSSARGSSDSASAKNVRWNQYGSNRITIGYDATVSGYFFASSGMQLLDRSVLYGKYTGGSLTVSYDAKMYSIDPELDGGAAIGPFSGANVVIPSSAIPGVTYVGLSEDGDIQASEQGVATSILLGIKGTSVSSWNHLYNRTASALRSMAANSWGLSYPNPGQFGNSQVWKSGDANSALDFSKPDLSSLSQRLGKGTWVDGVNTLTGRHSTNVSLGSISTSSGVSFPLALNYLAPNPRAFRRGIRSSQSSPVGFGWSFELPSIQVDHKGTLMLGDDDYYANLGPWGGGLMVSDGTSDGFHLDTDPRVKIRPLNGSTVLWISGWKVLLPDSTEIVLGGSGNAIRKTWAQGDKIAQPLFVRTEFKSGDYVPYRWDVLEVRSRRRSGCLKFSWIKTSGGLNWSGTTKFDRESELASISSFGGGFSVDLLRDTSLLDTSLIVDQVKLEWGQKGWHEVIPRSDLESVPFPKMYVDTKYLSGLVFLASRKEYSRISLKYKLVDASLEDQRFLRKVEFFQGTEVDTLSYHFSYDSLKTGWLIKAVDPQRNVTEYQLGEIDVRGIVLGRDSASYPVYRWYKDTTKVWDFRTERLQDRYVEYTSQFTDDHSTCSGDFCFQVFRIGGTQMGYGSNHSAGAVSKPGGNAFDAEQRIRIYKTVGGGVRQVFDSTVRGKIFPSDGYFVLWDDKGGNIRVFEWDGSRFFSSNPFEGDARKVSDALGLVPGPGYFLVAFKSFVTSKWADWIPVEEQWGGNEIVPVVRKSSGWTSLNRDIEHCDVTAKYNADGTAVPYGERALFGCLTFGTGDKEKVPNLQYSATERFFVVLDMRYGQIAVFNRTGDGSEFVNTTQRMRIPRKENMPSDWYQLFHNGVLPWNLNKTQPISLVAANDQFLITTAGGSHFDRLEWRWDGRYWQAARDAVAIGNTNVGPDGLKYETVWPTIDGHVSVDEGRGIMRYKDAPETDLIEYDYSACINVDACAMHAIDASKDVSPNIKTSPSYTWVQYHTLPPPMREVSEYPKTKEGAESTVKGYLFKTNPMYDGKSHVAFEDVTNQTLNSKCPTGLYDVDISLDERMLVAKCQYKMSNAGKIACGNLVGDETCHIDIYQIPMVALGGYERVIQPSSTWKLLQSFDMYGQYSPGLKVSRGRGVAMYTWGRPDSMYVEFVPTFEEGIRPSDDISPTLDGSVVNRVTKYSLYPVSGRASQRMGSVMAMKYGGSGDSLSYDGLSLSPESRSTTIYRMNFEMTDTLSVETLDHWGWNYPSGAFTPHAPELAGELKKRVLRPQGQGYVTNESVQGVAKGCQGWSKSEVHLFDSSVTVVKNDVRGGCQSYEKLSGRVDPHSLLPQVFMTLLPDNESVTDVIGAEYRHVVTLRLYNDLGALRHSRVVAYKNRDSARILLNPVIVPSIVDQVNEQIELGTAIAISADSIEYLANNIDVNSRAGWGQGGVFDPTKVEVGQVVSPHSFFSGWVKRDSIGIRNKFGQPLQSVVVTDPNRLISSVSVIEGRRGLVTATISPAWPEDVAVMTAEDGQVGLNDNSAHVFGQKKWYIPSGVSFDSTMNHLGRFSLKVMGGAGPAATVRLYDRATLRAGLDVSAWVYAPTGTNPSLTTQIRWSPSSSVSNAQSFVVPVGGTLKTGVWQRWLKHLSYDELRNMGILNATNGTADLVISVSGGASETIWVDDFVVRPALSSLSLVSHDHMGRVIGSMDGQGHWTKTEYDIRGRVQAVRDEHGRILSQGSTLSAGEN